MMGEKGNLAGAGDLLGIGSGAELGVGDQGADPGMAHGGGGGGAAKSIVDQLSRGGTGGVDTADFSGADHDTGGDRSIGFGADDGPKQEDGPGRGAGPGH